MNKIYKVIYCKATQTFVAVSEFAKGQGKGSVHGQRRSVRRAGSAFNGRMKLLSLSVLIGLGGLSNQAMAEKVNTDLGLATVTTVGTGLAGGTGSSAKNNATAFGVGASAKGNGVAVGKGANTTAAGGTAVGLGASAAQQGTAIGVNSATNGRAAIAMGAAASSGAAGTQQTTAIGNLAVASGDQSMALGADTLASGNSSIAIGGDDLDKVAGTAQGDTVTFADGTSSTVGWNTPYTYEQAVEMNDSAVAQKYNELTGDILVHYENSDGVSPVTADAPSRYTKTQSGEGAVAVGVSSTAGDLATAFGTRANADGIASISLGVGSHATMENSVAIGAGSKTDVGGTSQTSTTIEIGGVSQSYSWAGGTDILAGDVVSVGSAGFERQIKNVAAGAVTEESTDAINGSQLYGVTTALQTQIQDVDDKENYFHVNTIKVDVDGDGKLDANEDLDGDGHLDVVEDLNGNGQLDTALNEVTDNVDYNGDGDMLDTSVSEDVDGDGILDVADEDTDGDGNLDIDETAGNGGTGNATTNQGGLNEAGGATAKGALAAGVNATATAENAVSMGYMSKASGESAIAIGDNAQATGKQSISIGTENVVSGDNSGAIGDPSYISGDGTYTIGNDNGTATDPIAADNAGAFGNDNLMSDAADGSRIVGNTNNVTVADAFVLGNSVVADVKNSVYLGTDSQATEGAAVGTAVLDSAGAAGATTTAGDTGTVKNATVSGTTYGDFAGATANGVVTVGAAGSERRIQNVAAGEISKTSTDAINGSQLYAVASTLEAADTHYYSVNAVDSLTNYNNDGASGRNSLAAGVDVSVGNGWFSTATGSYSEIEGGTAANPVVGGFSSSYGTFNNITTNDGAKVQSGLASIVTGTSNEVVDSNGAIVVGAGNTVTDSYNETTINISAEVATLAAAEDAYEAAQNPTTLAALEAAKANLETAMENITAAADEKDELGGTGVFGGGNTAENTRQSMITGIKNDFKNGTKTTVLGYKNTVSGVSDTDTADKNFISGVDNTLTDLGDDNIVMGSNIKTSGLKNSQLFGTDLTVADNTENGVVVGSNASISQDGGVALGYQSNANTAAGITGANPLNATIDETPTWKSTAAAVSVGDVDKGITRQITDVAAGTADTDAVNVAQLKAVTNVVSSGFNISADKAGTTDTDIDGNVGTNLDNVKLGEKVTYTGGKGVSTTVDNNEVTFDVDTDGKTTEITYTNAAGDTVYLLDDGTYNTAKDGLGTAVDESDINGSQVSAITSGITVNDGSNVNNPKGTVTAAEPTSLVTAGDVADAINNSGFTVTSSANGGVNTNSSKELVKPGDTLELVAGEHITIDQKGGKFTFSTNNQAIAESAQLPVVYTDADGNKVYLQDDGTFNTVADGTGDTVQPADVITSMQSPDGSTKTPTVLTNVASTLPGTKGNTTDADGNTIDPDTADSMKAPTLNDSQLSNAATVDDVLSAGWNLQESGEAVDLVTAYDTVNFAAEGAASVKSNTKDGVSTITYGVNVDGATITTNDVTDSDGNTTTQLTANTGDLINAGDNTDNPGQVGAGKKPDALTTASDVADAINSAYHNVAGTNSEKQATGKGASAKISAGDTVTVEAGKNLVLDADGKGKLTLSTATKVAFEKVTGETVVIGDPDDNSTTLTSTADGLDVGGDKITNVAAGDISANSTDAVNGSQLFNQVAASKEEVKSDDKSVTVTTTQNDVGANVFDLSVNTDGTTITKDPTTGAVKAVTSDITSADDGSVTATTPTSLATAGDVAEAINNSGFTAGNANTDTLVTESTGSTVINPGDSLTIEAGKNLSSSFDAETGELKISTADDVNFNSVESDTVVIGDSTGDSTTLTSTADGLSVGGDKITNVAAGTADTDAVNVSQLNDVADDVADNTTNITNNTTNITNNAADIATNISNITTNAADIAENADNIALGLNFAADSGDTVNRQLGDTVDITGDGNITTVTTDTGVEVQLASDLTADSLTTGDTVVNTDGITISGDDADSTVSLTKDGLNNGGNTITNVAPGVNGTDAANVDQLNAMGNRLSTRINEVEDEANAGTASALAAANLPQPHDPGASMVSAGLGYYEGEGAFAVGVSTISDNGRWILKGSATVNTESNVGVGAGIGYQW